MTKIERLLLVNQYYILEKLDSIENLIKSGDNAVSDNTKKSDYERYKIALENGYEKYYPNVQDLDQEICKTVEAILEMYASIYRSNSKLDKNSRINYDEIKFKGFGEDDEIEYATFTEYLIETLGHYTESKISTSCTPGKPSYLRRYNQLPKYSSMLEVWASYDKSDEMNLDQIKNVINAK